MTDDAPIDVVVIGAGAAGLMCAITAGERGRSVLLIEHSAKVGNKILISGGGRCNFTNLDVGASNYQSENPHFAKSALSRFTPQDFIDRVERKGIAYHEKTLGQLFCDDRAHQIVNLLLDDARDAGVEIWTKCSVTHIEKSDHFTLSTELGEVQAHSLVIATGGLSIPQMGSTSFGYDVAKQFGHTLTPCAPALAPFTLTPTDRETYTTLSGISTPVAVSCNGQTFREALLFTHRGLSGPAMLQINSYWRPGQSIEIDLLPEHTLSTLIAEWKPEQPKAQIRTLLSHHLPKRLVRLWIENSEYDKAINQVTPSDIEALSALFHHWILKPAGDEGYAKAEVTRGGVNTNELSSKTLESNTTAGLYFVGEVVDVTGWLGGFNFQWAWASGYCAGQYA